MKQVLKFLKDCSTFYIATNDGDQPHVRPFGAVCEFETRLYIITNNKKKVYKEMITNPKIEISGMVKGQWIRLEAEVVHDSRREARVAMMDEYKSALGRMYHVDDGLMEVFYLENGKAIIHSLTGESENYTF